MGPEGYGARCGDTHRSGPVHRRVGTPSVAEGTSLMRMFSPGGGYKGFTGWEPTL